ncbi:hypothetical protein A5733_11460 [Mycobacterium sp. NS-7484]|uniref:hypothetical protein n=1 Tax=Mycobacterium sp. NS-7484 TaxID=1834161 RepID=UPI00096F0C80|nr:hypothetical protein [Mycobacterium sp. NS-7484]OMB96482.1 hypothetical protein A5733_11460 [Mycobacterium sp. NS-7484]
MPEYTPQDTGVTREWWTTHARNPDRVLPRGVFGSTGPGGEPITTTTDHRMLWHVRDELLGAPPYLRGVFELLNDYLAANCQHHWRDYPTCCTPRKDDCFPPHRQCLWCNSVEELPDA